MTVVSRRLCGAKILCFNRSRCTRTPIGRSVGREPSRRVIGAGFGFVFGVLYGVFILSNSQSVLTQSTTIAGAALLAAGAAGAASLALAAPLLSVDPYLWLERTLDEAPPSQVDRRPDRAHRRPADRGASRGAPQPAPMGARRDDLAERRLRPCLRRRADRHPPARRPRRRVRQGFQQQRGEHRRGSCGTATASP